MAAIGWNAQTAADANRYDQGKRDSVAVLANTKRRDMRRWRDRVHEHVDDWRAERADRLGEASWSAAYYRRQAKAVETRGVPAMAHRASPLGKVDVAIAVSGRSAADLARQAVETEAEAEAYRRQSAPGLGAPVRRNDRDCYRCRSTPTPGPRGDTCGCIQGPRYMADCRGCGEPVYSRKRPDWQSSWCAACTARGDNVDPSAWVDAVFA